MQQVLVIKNERSLAKKIVSGLTQEGYFILKIHNENQGLNIIYEQDWDIIILDWDSLSISGPEICRQIRLVKTTPIIIVTNNISSKDCIAGLQAGADDYIRKPFVKEELVARVQAILRRSDCIKQNETNFFQFKDLFVDASSNIVKKGGENLSLTKREYDLLLFLVKNKNKILHREMLLDQVWGYNVVVSPNVVDLYIGYVRKKLKCEKKDRYIQTIHGRGYSMVE
ncbi:response regulator transcription factor [Bacillus cereus]|uniref:response regulator transcription factor n=1 Tax=Bacillus cereus TaxID=1396 RepID=UPI0024076DB5|nr:response regulator transcription factor [Bacillus cereus]MDF9507551.1 response regulator transcription factor [Bacillus cereus]MDF9596681.1 response regulator transcription factor [Bacillus cereus]MDF9609381.1 response regulator transcription factor [Bacillus cereus]MDF9659951.1 response regulator transcription factor [Bacillus cereus]